MVLISASAAAAEFGARIEAGVAQPLSEPARDYFGPGFTLGAGGGVDLFGFLELGARVSYVFVSRRGESPLAGPASLFAIGPTVRIHRPRPAWWRPFGELSLQYVRTGPLDRLGLSFSGGAHFQVGPLALGPWLGLEQIFRLTDTATYPTRDATVFMAGVSVELGFRTTTEARVVPPPPPSHGPPQPPPPRLAGPDDADRDGVVGRADGCPNLPEDPDGFEDDDGCPETDDDGDGVLDADDVCPRVAGTSATHGCADRDLDTVSDADDRCPDVRGDPNEHGCPAYREVKVETSRLQLARPIDFARGSSAIPAAATPMLDEAARAVMDRGTLCVRVEAHGDKKGKPNANQALANARADSVRMHLMARGVSPSRITAAGAGARPPFADAELLLVPCEVRAP